VIKLGVSGTPRASGAPRTSTPWIANIKSQIITSINHLTKTPPAQPLETNLLEHKLRLEAWQVKLESRERELNIRETELNSKLGGLKDTLHKYEERLQRLESALNVSGKLAALKDLTWDRLGISPKDVGLFEINDKTPWDIMLRGFKSIYREFAKKLHPDHRGNEEKFKDLQNAWERIKDILWKLMHP
jgi:hypothetical protein